jgi:serine/threonine protein kinase
MNGLYKKVLKGSYPEIPKKYTKDLADTIMLMLNVDPKQRPSCDEILDIEQVRRRIPKLYPDELNDEKYIRPNSQQNNTTELSELLNTIKVP